MSKLIILDRDGVINHESANYIKSHEEFVVYPGTIPAIIKLNKLGYKIAVCTNQSGIGRKLFTLDDLHKIHAKMLKLVVDAGGSIEAVFFCPHMEEDNCQCRKPRTRMLVDACQHCAITDTSQVFMVGDSYCDMLAIAAIQGTPVLVMTGKGQHTAMQDNLPSNTMRFTDLFDFSCYIEQRALCHDT